MNRVMVDFFSPFRKKSRKAHLFWLYLLLGVFLFYKSIFNVFSGQFLLAGVFAQFSTSAKIEKFSLLYGFIFEEVKVGGSLPEGPLFTAERVGLEYNLPLILTGRFKITLISLVKPRIHLVKKNGKWNYESIFPFGDPAPPAKENTASEINTFLPVSAYFKLKIDDLDIQLDDSDEKDKLNLSLEDLNFAVELNAKRFSKLPIGHGMLKLIDTLTMSVNPGNELKIKFRDNSRSLVHPFRLSWNIKKSGKDFFSRMDIGGEKIELKAKNKITMPFGFQVFYEMNYHPEAEKVIMKEFSIYFNNDVWVTATGSIDNAMSDSRLLNFNLTRSLIRLEPLAYVINSLPGTLPIKMRGELSLAPISLNGKMDNLSSRIKISGKNIYYKDNLSIHSVPLLEMLLSGNYDFTVQEKETRENPLPFIRNLLIEKIALIYNGTTIFMTGDIKKDKKNSKPVINMDITFTNLHPEKFNPDFEGIGSGKLKLYGVNYNNLKLTGQINIQSFRFAVDKIKSSTGSSLNIILDTNLVSTKPLTPDHYILNDFRIKQMSRSGIENLKIAMKGDVFMADDITARLSSYNLITRISELSPTLPLPLRDTILPMKDTIGDRIELGGYLDYNLNKNITKMKGSMDAVFADMGINDLKMNYSIKMTGEERIDIDFFKMVVFKNIFKTEARGKLIKKKDSPDFIPFLTLNANIESDIPAYLYNGITFNGKINVNFVMDGKWAKGNFTSKHSTISTVKGKCPGSCNIFKIVDMQASIPIKHDLEKVATPEIIEANKSTFIRTSGVSLPKNFTIHSVIGTHPSLKNTPFVYIANNGSEPGFAASVNYYNNIFRVDEMKMRMLDGSILARDILLNVGNGRPENMEYNATFEVRDIDLKQLMHPRLQKKIDDGKIRADLNVSGRNLEEPVENMDMFFSVFRIGKDFSKSAMNVLSPQNAVSDFIVDSYAVNDINVRLSKGLVYAVFSLKKPFPSPIHLSIKENKITQERMPLANFLKRARSEIGSYQ